MNLTVDLPWTTPPLTGNRVRGNVHARNREVQDAKDVARWHIRKARLTPIVGAEVTLHMRPATRHRRDADGLAPTLKVCLDALVAERILPDDSWVCVPAATCRIHPPDGGPAAMWLELTDIHPYDKAPA